MKEATIKILFESEIDEALDAKIRLFLLDIFPNWASVFRVERTWHEARPIFTALATEPDGSIAGHVAVVERTITTDWNFRYSVASVQGVSVSLARRGSGLSTRLLDAALEEARREKFPYAILFCREPLAPFYERNGWRFPNDSMVMWRDRELPIHMQSNCPMYRELTDEPFPEGPLDVHNPL